MQRLPSLREKSLLLVRMMFNFEKRFPEEFELQAQFLELVNYVYRLEMLELITLLPQVLHNPVSICETSYKIQKKVDSLGRHHPTWPSWRHFHTFHAKIFIR